jgi:hypothetical protein
MDRTEVSVLYTILRNWITPPSSDRGVWAYWLFFPEHGTLKIITYTIYTSSYTNDLHYHRKNLLYNTIQPIIRHYMCIDRHKCNTCVIIGMYSMTCQTTVLELLLDTYFFQCSKHHWHLSDLNFQNSYSNIQNRLSKAC